MSKNVPPTKTNDANDAALRAALAANPGATASALAYDAGMSVSTARAILGRMEDDGTAVRTTDPDTRRPTYLWTLIDTADTTAAPAPAGRRAGREPKKGTPAPAASTNPAPADTRAARATGSGGTTKGSGGTAKGSDPANAGDTASAPGAAGPVEKLPSGALRGMVEDHLREHPGESFSPTALKHALEKIHAPRQLSSGAINNALEKLTVGGVAIRTSDAPKKWALAAGA
ncbi:hypothetical protein [Nocardia wallacei]|uniref:hypothetical protein n=1 Tax=Nocardia wallacei TaxID=480035 RepID=UPI0024539E18|nr:hypothetical protein [Nocardia wallacei]